MVLSRIPAADFRCFAYKSTKLDLILVRIPTGGVILKGRWLFSTAPCDVLLFPEKEAKSVVLLRRRHWVTNLPRSGTTGVWGLAPNKKNS
jgi:hypothetical protein